MASCLVEFFSFVQHLKYRKSLEALLMILCMGGKRLQNSTLLCEGGLKSRLSAKINGLDSLVERWNSE